MSAIAAVAGKLGDEAERVLARIGGELGGQARAAFAALRALEPAAQKRQRAAWLASARMVVPEGFRLIHPTWIEAALAELPAAARDAVANLGGEPRDVWLARCAMAGFVAMPTRRVEVVQVAAELPALAPEQLQAWLERAGAEQLKRAAQIAGVDATPRSARAFGSDRDVIERCRVPADELRFIRIGARAFAAHFSPIVRRQIAQRLPRALGLAVRAELNRPANSVLGWIP